MAWGNHKRKLYTVGQENMEEVDVFTVLGYMGIAIGKKFELLNRVYLLLKTFNAGLKLTTNNFPTREPEGCTNLKLRLCTDRD